MIKRADLGLITLFCSLDKLVHFAGKSWKVVHPMQKWQYVLISGRKRCFEQTDALCWKSLKKRSAQCENVKTCWSRANNAVLLFGQTRALCWKELKSGAPSAKMTVRADLGLTTLFCTNSCTLLKSAKKWWAQCENDKSVIILGWKSCFVQTLALCWKELKSGALSAKMTVRADLVLKTLFCTNSCTFFKKS